MLVTKVIKIIDKHHDQFSRYAIIFNKFCYRNINLQHVWQGKNWRDWTQKQWHWCKFTTNREKPTIHQYVSETKILQECIVWILLKKETWKSLVQDNTLRASKTIYSYFNFGLKNSSFQVPYQCPSSSADRARDLFKDSNGLASLVDCTWKKFFVEGCRFFVSDVISEAVLG